MNPDPRPELIGPAISLLVVVICTTESCIFENNSVGVRVVALVPRTSP